MASNSRALEFSSPLADRSSAGLSGFAGEYATYDGLGLAKLIADKRIPCIRAETSELLRRPT
jgi:hypothetical protein